MANRNGYFQLNNKQDGTYLKLYKPQGNGLEVDYKDLLIYLEKQNIKEYDLQILQSALLNQTRDREVKLTSNKIPAVDEKFEIDVSEDKTLVRGRFYPPSNDGNLLTEKDIIKWLNTKIKHGIVLPNIISFVKNRRYCEDIILAEATKPAEGKDGYIEYNFNIEKDNKPKINEDGSVDHRSIGLFNPAQQGQVLATLQRGVPGKLGTDVYGKNIMPKKVKEPRLRPGRNTHLSEDELSLISDISGHIKFDGEKISVSNTYEVEKNVDASTGDIRYDGTVHVRGSVMTGYSIKAKEDVIVDGVVEGARIEAGGDITIRHGIHGNNRGSIIAGGNILARFIENAYIFAHGNLTAGEILHSNISVKGEISVGGGKGLIIGGHTKSETNIRAKRIGSIMETNTIVEISTDLELGERNKDINEQIIKNKSSINRLGKVISLYNSKIENKERISQDKFEQLKTIAKEYVRLNEEVEDLTNELNAINSKKIDGIISVEKQAHQGVQIVIGVSSYTLDKTVYATRFKREDGEIKLI